MYLDSIRIWSLSLLGCSLGQWQDSSVTMGTSVFRGGLVYLNLSGTFNVIRWPRSLRMEIFGNRFQGSAERQIYYTMRWESCLIVLQMRQKVQLLLFVRESQWKSDAEHCRTNSRSGHECKGLPFGKLLGMKTLVTSYHILSSKVQT